MSEFHKCVDLVILKGRIVSNSVLEQGPAAIEEAASFGEKKIRWSYDAVARFQLESRARNHDFGIERSRRQRYLSGREGRAHPLH